MARHRRTFWIKATAAAEAGAAHAEVAARFGVSVGALRSWLYKLRQERAAASIEPMRLLPVTVREATPEAFGPEVEAGGYRLRFAPGADPRYVAAVVRALAAE